MTTHDLPALADEEHAYLTTSGRVTGDPHEIEIWFSTDGDRVHLLSGNGEGSDWVQNLLADPHATVRIAGETHAYRARFDLDDDERHAAAARHDHHDHKGGRCAPPTRPTLDAGAPS